MATPRFATYDPGRQVLVVNGVQIQGFAPGTFIKVSRMTPTFSSKAGADGQVVRTKSRDKRGKIEITLLQTSLSNDYLSSLAVTDEQADGASTAVGPSMVKDLNGTTFATGANTWVVQPADLELAAEAGDRTWTLECDNLQIVVGGSLV
jgi:hypothetical protein